MITLLFFLLLCLTHIPRGKVSSLVDHLCYYLAKKYPGLGKEVNLGRSLKFHLALLMCHIPTTKASPNERCVMPLLTCIVLITEPPLWNTWLHLTGAETGSDKCKVNSCKGQSRNLRSVCWPGSPSSDPHFSTFITHVHDKRNSLSKNSSPSLLHTEKIEIRIFLTSNSCWPRDQCSSIVLYGI